MFDPQKLHCFLLCVFSRFRCPSLLLWQIHKRHSYLSAIIIKQARIVKGKSRKRGRGASDWSDCARSSFPSLAVDGFPVTAARQAERKALLPSTCTSDAPSLPSCISLNPLLCISPAALDHCDCKYSHATRFFPTTSSTTYLRHAISKIASYLALALSALLSASCEATRLKLPTAHRLLFFLFCLS